MCDNLLLMGRDARVGVWELESWCRGHGGRGVDGDEGGDRGMEKRQGVYSGWWVESQPGEAADA